MFGFYIVILSVRLQKVGKAAQLDHGAKVLLKSVAIHFHQKGGVKVDDNKLAVI